MSSRGRPASSVPQSGRSKPPSAAPSVPPSAVPRIRRTSQAMAGDDDPRATAPPVAAEAPPAVEAPAPPATTDLPPYEVPPQPDLEAAQAPPVPEARPATRGWRGRFGRKRPADEEDAAAAAAAAPVAPADDAYALPPSTAAELGAEAPAESVQVPPRKWPQWNRLLWLGWDSRPWPPASGAYANERPAPEAAAPEAGAAGAAGAAGSTAAAAGDAWLSWPSFGGVPAAQREPEPWCKDYVKVGAELAC